MDVELTRPLRAADGTGSPAVITTIREALQFVATVDAAHRRKLHWRLAHNILEFAQMRNEPEIVELATDAVENALATDQWLET
jgi:hypothetical protein